MMTKQANFETALREKLTVLGIDLPTPLWMLISLLDSQGQCFTSTSGGELFLSLDLVSTKDERRSHLRFELPPHDMMKYWLGKDGYERSIIPLLPCGADGSYFALWFSQHHENPQFVFLGSEGECFVAAETVRNFITLITMGYISIEGRDVLAATPQETGDTGWIEPAKLKAWAQKNVAAVYPATGSELLPYSNKNDPFVSFIDKVINA